MQKILSLGTASCSLRANVESWGWEDGDCVAIAYTDHVSKYSYMNLPVGLIRSWVEPPNKAPHYPTVLHAIGDGWKLLAPPQDTSWVNSDGVKITEFSWWLVRD